MFRRLVVALCAIMAAGALLSAEAHRLRSRGGGENLVVIAEHDIDLAIDRYSIDISKAKGGYKGIRVKAKQGFFDLSSVQVIYADGSKHDEVRQIDMYQGERSRQINPTGDHRFIDQVNITQVPGRGRGRLQILGIQNRDGRDMSRGDGGYSGRPRPSTSGGGDDRVTPASPPPAPASDPAASTIESKPTAPVETAAPVGRPSEGGDVLFGAQYVGFGVDRDVVRVGNEIGKFERIRLRVLENDIFINELKVVYSNGETDTLAVNANVPKNSRTNWIDLKGDRFI